MNCFWVRQWLEALEKFGSVHQAGIFHIGHSQSLPLGVPVFNPLLRFLMIREGP